jgi:hypothetical protein
MRLKLTSRMLLMACVMVLTVPVANAQGIDYSGDIRIGFIDIERDERSGQQTDDEQFRMRARAGLLWTINDTWSFKGRYAGLVHDSRNQSGFIGPFKGLTLGNSSIAPGQSAIDEFFVRARYGKWDHRIGRFQSNNRLIGVAAKSLSRTNSISWFVGWTDGLQSTYRADHGLNYTAIIEFNDKDGPSNVRRSPLGFDKSSSRAGYYVSVEAADTDGFWAQRSVDVTYIPSSLYHNGFAAGQTRDYLGISARLATQVTIREQMKLVSGVELAWAPETQTRAAANLPGTGKTHGTAWQWSLNLMDILPGHSIGLVYGENEAGWLLSTDYSNNQSLLEFRYAWEPMSGHLLETRIRERDDLNLLRNAARKRAETDIYLRYTISL